MSRQQETYAEMIEEGLSSGAYGLRGSWFLEYCKWYRQVCERVGIFVDTKVANNEEA